MTYIVCNHEWSFFEGEKKNSHTLKAGRHLFPFQLHLGGSLPSTLYTNASGGSSVTYKLRATATRPGFAHNLQTQKLITLLRSFVPEAVEFQQMLEIENTWPEKIMYSIMVPHKAWAAGDDLTAAIKLSPLAKGVRPLSVVTTLNETIKVHSRTGWQESTRPVVTTRHEFRNGRAVWVEQRDHRSRSGSGSGSSHSRGMHSVVASSCTRLISTWTQITPSNPLIPLPTWVVLCSSLPRRARVPPTTIRPTTILKLGLPLQQTLPFLAQSSGASPIQFRPMSSNRKRTLSPNSRFPFHFARRPHTLWSLSSHRIVYAGASSWTILTDTRRSCAVPYHCIYSTIAFSTKRNLPQPKRDDYSSVGLKCRKRAAPIMNSYQATHRTFVTESRTCICRTKPSCVSSIHGYIRASVQYDNLKWIKTGDRATSHRACIRLSRHTMSHLP